VGAGGEEHEGRGVAPESLFEVDCGQAVHQLYDYLDGELTEERRVEIAHHLDLCRPCAGAAEFEAELRVVIASGCKDRVPASLVERVARALEEEQQRSGA
jgi:mycothiol system anti-sigma-R factor